MDITESVTTLTSLSPCLCLNVFVGGIGTPRWRESSGIACITAGHSTDPSFPALPPALLLGIFSTGQGGPRRGHGGSQPPPPTHGTAGFEPQSSGSVFTATFAGFFFFSLSNSG